MPGNRTLTMIKPDAVSNGHIGAILNKIVEAGFRIIAMKYTKLSQEKASKFYAVHSEKPFYNDLVNFMTSGPIVAAILEKDNAVETFRKLIGATNPAEAEEGTIRNFMLPIWRKMQYMVLIQMKMPGLKEIFSSPRWNGFKSYSTNIFVLE